VVNWTHVLQDLGNVKTIILTLTVWVRVTLVAIFWALAGPRLQIPTLCDPMDCSLPDSSIHGIFQARVLEWVAIFFSTQEHFDGSTEKLRRLGLLI